MMLAGKAMIAIPKKDETIETILPTVVVGYKSP